MALIRRLTDEEASVLNIIQDPVLFSEFLRNTNNGSLEKETWPSRRFKLRWYQKDLLTDKTEYIVLTAGRAVGKCSPLSSTIYTDSGFMSIRDLINSKDHSHVIFALDDDGNFVKRRASVAFHKTVKSYRLTTAAGYEFTGTKEHPILTEHGYVELGDLDIGHEIAVATKLPEPSTNSVFNWFELRWLGYVMTNNRLNAETPIAVKWQKQLAEIHMIAKFMDCKVLQDPTGAYRIVRRFGGKSHYSSRFIRDLFGNTYRQHSVKTFPKILKRECNKNIKVMLESFLSIRADIGERSVKIACVSKNFAEEIRECMLRFGVETRLLVEDGTHYLETLDYDAYCKFFQEFNLPGVSVKNLPEPIESRLPYRYDRIVAIKEMAIDRTYSVYVHDLHNYISDYAIVHNSLVVEDKLLFDAVNADTEFPDETKEQLLVTPNFAQMNTILDRIINRSQSSPIIKDYLKNQVNRTKGTLDYTGGVVQYRMYARIAGSRGENNMVGLHQPKIMGDEMQIFPIEAFVQMEPTYNGWQKGRQQFFCGVPNGIREGNVLYNLDQRSPNFKKYRIPAHNNKYFSLQDNLNAVRKYQGEDSDSYMQLVLGKHGNAAFTVVPRDSIVVEPYDFFSYRYNEAEKNEGKPYFSALGIPKIPQEYSSVRIMAVDTGFADPTIIQILGKDGEDVWRTLVRYKLTRIPFPMQSEIIAWLYSFYDPHLVAIDIGAGGGGIGIMQELVTDRYKMPEKVILPVRFNDPVITGVDKEGNEVKEQTKAYAGQTIARMIADKNLRFSEADYEGISQIERISYQRRPDGSHRFFVLSDRGVGASDDDHIFASYVVFIMGVESLSVVSKPVIRLFSSRWI